MPTTRERITEAHTSARLFPLARTALDRAIAEGTWGRVVALAKLCELTNDPCIDRLEDVDAIMSDHVLRVIAYELCI